MRWYQGGDSLATRLRNSGKPLKRIRQFAYLCCHPVGHYHCASAIRDSRLVRDPSIALKYLGDHLALSLRPQQRRTALTAHYQMIARILLPSTVDSLHEGLLIWRKDVADCPALTITLEPSKLAPMEGELQLRFSFRSDLCVLTFLLAHGEPFGAHQPAVLFVGGVQGRLGAREELREASRCNGEISPSGMLFLALQAIGKALDISEIIGIGEDDHISTGYSRARITFDYRRFWTELGGVRRGRHYAIPLDTPAKPISETSPSHRSRARRKRRAKGLVRQSIESHVRLLIGPVAALPV